MKINKNKLPLVRSLRCELAMVPFSEPRVTDTAMATVRVPPPPKPTNAINNTRKNKKKKRQQLKKLLTIIRITLINAPIAVQRK